MDAKALEADMKVFHQMNKMLQLVNQLSDGLSDTRMPAGKENYLNALNYYNSVKHAKKMDYVGARAIYEDINPRFAKTKSNKK